MGSLNCCIDKFKKNDNDTDNANDNDFNVEEIFSPVYEIKDSSEDEIENIADQPKTIIQKEKKPLFENIQDYENFDYSCNSVKNSLSPNDSQQPSLFIKQHIKNFSFRRIESLFNIKFIDEINKFRTDFLGFSKKLKDYAQNFDKIKNIIDRIYVEDIRLHLSRTKEDFEKTSNFLEEFHNESIKENKGKLSDLVEIDEIKLPIPFNKEELNDTKYYKKFDKRFLRKFGTKFKLEKTKSCLVHEDPEIAFLFFITKEVNKKKYLFDNKMKYIAVDFVEHSKGIIFMTIVLARDSIKN